MEQLSKVFDNSRQNETTEILTNQFLTKSTCCIRSQHGYLQGLTSGSYSYYLCRYLQILPSYGGNSTNSWKNTGKIIMIDVEGI